MPASRSQSHSVWRFHTLHWRPGSSDEGLQSRSMAGLLEILMTTFFGLFVFSIKEITSLSCKAWWLASYLLSTTWTSQSESWYPTGCFSERQLRHSPKDSGGREQHVGGGCWGARSKQQQVAGVAYCASGSMFSTSKETAPGTKSRKKNWRCSGSLATSGSSWRWARHVTMRSIISR